MLAKERFDRHIALAALAAVALVACNGGSVQTAAVAGKVLTGIQVLPSTAEALAVPLGHDLQFTAIGSYSDGSTADVTASVSWESSDLSVATISLAGIATPVATGTASITATDMGSGVSASVAMSVTAADLFLLSISPIDPTILIGTTLQLEASGLLEDDSTVDYTGSVSWTSSDETVATVSPTGLATALALGSTTITATDPVSGASDSITLQVTDVPAALAYVVLSRGSVIGGSTTVAITGTVVLTSYATDPVLVTLASTNESVVTVPPSVTISAGTDRATFPVTTYSVTHRTRVFVTATDGTVTKKAGLNVRVQK